MALTLNGATPDYLQYSGAVRSSMPLSIAGWVNISSAGGTIMMIADSGVGDQYYWLVCFGTKVNAIKRNSGSQAIAAATNTPAFDTWQHAAGVFASSTSTTVYSNGGNSATSTTSGTPTGLNRTRIGYASDSTADWPVYGLVAEVGVWDIALAASNVLSLSKGVSPLHVHPESLIGYWPLIGHSSPSRDLVGSAPMSLINSPTAGAHPRIIRPRSRIWRPPVAAASQTLWAQSAL